MKYSFGVRDTRPGTAINVGGTRHVLELMRELRIPKGVYTSTLAVNGDAGPSHDLLVNDLTRQLPMVPQRTAFCWAHVDDVANGHVRAMERGTPGENYHTP